MFILSEAMNFSALPNAGGLYDQHPDLLDQWMVILQAKARYERRKQAEQKQQMGKHAKRSR